MPLVFYTAPQHSATQGMCVCVPAVVWLLLRLVFLSNFDGAISGVGDTDAHLDGMMRYEGAGKLGPAAPLGDWSANHTRGKCGKS